MHILDKLACVILICIMGALACTVQLGFNTFALVLAALFLIGVYLWTKF